MRARTCVLPYVTDPCVGCVTLLELIQRRRGQYFGARMGYAQSSPTMSAPDTPVKDDLNPTPTQGYQPGQKKSIQEYAQLDQEDESLRRWKESLGISASATEGALDPNAPKLTIHSLSLESSQIKSGNVSIQLDAPGATDQLMKNPLQIPEGIEYTVAIKFTCVVLR